MATAPTQTYATKQATKLWTACRSLLCDPQRVSITCHLLLIVEAALNWWIVENVRYTEIDWVAYMQEVAGFLNGTLDYQHLKGDTGPCVYPAGFLYIYSALYYLTDHGANVKRAQYVFIAIYALQSYCTYAIWRKTCKLPAYALVLCAATSYRIHSIYVLRLFNDPIAVLFLWMALNAFASGRWCVGSALYSLGVSVKMNILLYAPCLLMAYVAVLPSVDVVRNLAICVLVQLVLGAPFLLTHPVSYIRASFNLGRVFEHQWTVNFRFLPPDVFTSLWLHIGLLGLHVVLLMVFAPLAWRYLKSYATLSQALKDMRESNVRSKKTMRSKEEQLTKEQQVFIDSFEKQLMEGRKRKTESSGGSGGRVRKRKLGKSAQSAISEQVDEQTYSINFSKVSQLLVLPFFVANFIGIVCARSLHYQFYAWYFHSLLYLGFSTPFSKPVVFLLLGVLETCWNVYPSTVWSSALLHLVHVTLMVGLYRSMKV